MVLASQRFLQSPIGRLTITASDEGIVSVLFPGSKDDAFFTKSNIILKAKMTELQKMNHETAKVFFEDYFSGLETVTPPLKLLGTAFQLRVLRETLLVGYGATCTYSSIAHRISNPKATRAVGQALHLNPIPILIPCHRVVEKDGDIGGFAGGTNLKSWLIKHEHDMLKKRNKE